MKKLNFVVLILISTLLLGGCYESKVPLSKSPSSKIDQRLIRNWTSIPGSNHGRVVFLMLRKFNKNEYLVVWKEGKDGVLVITRGFTTRIKDTNIMNLQNIDSLEKKDRTYVFAKYRINKKGNLIINILNGDYADLKGREFKSSKDFKAFIRKNISKTGLFNESIEFKQTDTISFGINP